MSDLARLEDLPQSYRDELTAHNLVPLWPSLRGVLPPHVPTRVVLSAREMGRIFHAQGVERLVRNELWKGRTPERFYDAMEWLYGWRLDNCLSA